MHLAEARGAESTGVEFAGTARRQRLKGEGEGGLRKKDVRMTRKQAKLLNCAHFMIVFFVMLDLKLKSNSS